MKNIRIPVEECEDVFLRAKHMYNDKRIGKYHTPLNNNREPIKSIFGFAFRRGHITVKQRDYLEKILRYYQKVVDLNSNYEEGLRESVISLLEETVNLAELPSKGDKRLKTKRMLIKQRIKQIENGEYFWQYHMLHGPSLLNILQEKNVDVENLSEKMSNLIKKTTFNL